MFGLEFLWSYPICGWPYFLNMQINVFCQTWEVFSHWGFKYFFSILFLLLFFFLDSNVMNVRLLVSSHVLEALLSFQWYFSLYCSNETISIDLSSSFLCHYLQCAIDSIQGVLNFGYWIFLFYNFSLVHLNIFYFFAKTFCFSFISSVFVITCWNIYIIAAVKSLSDNSHIYVIVVLMSTDCLFHAFWGFSHYLYT